MTFEDIQRVNSSLKTTDIKGKDYIEVAQRIKAFRQLYPEGFIETTLFSCKDGMCVFQATVGYYATSVDNDGEICVRKMVLGTGTAYEKEQSSYINKTSYIAN